MKKVTNLSMIVGLRMIFFSQSDLSSSKLKNIVNSEKLITDTLSLCLVKSLISKLVSVYFSNLHIMFKI